MYSIKLMHGHGLTGLFDGTELKRYQTAYCQLLWEGDDGKQEVAGTGRACVWTPKTAKRADEWARRQGRELMADRGAYLRKHGERKEVVEDRKRKAEEAERRRISGIRSRCAARWEEIIKVLAAHDERLAGELEHG